MQLLKSVRLLQVEIAALKGLEDDHAMRSLTSKIYNLEATVIVPLTSKRDNIVFSAYLF